eukprot:Anaeramoba_ignava/a616692_20.p1 GENE.a616692_20~~a616692_20.p1  ORF type:complete len:416 (-),score=83.97 a616692_20:418-1665(-)
MLIRNHKYLNFILLLGFAFGAQNLMITKESEGVYEAVYSKSFTIGEKLDIDIHDFYGEILINGNGDNRLKIDEICSFKSYSEKDAETKYYKSKVGFILNNNKLEIDGKKETDKIENIINLDVPDFTNISIKAEDSEIVINQTDGDITILGKDSQVDFNKVSSKIKVKGKNLDVHIADCSLIGDVLLSRGMLNISKLKSDYLNAEVYGADLEASDIDARVVFKSTGGDIYIDNAKNDAKLYASGGDITVEEINGNIFCDSKGGMIELGTVGGMCKIISLAGEVNIEEVQDDLNISAKNSDIEVEKALGSIIVDSANQDVEIYKYTLGEDFSVTIKNQNADIDFYIEESVNADLNARIDYTSGDDDDYEIESDFTLDNEKKERNGKLGYISKYGSINGGGNTVILKNQNGDIYIYEE